MKSGSAQPVVRPASEFATGPPAVLSQRRASLACAAQRLGAALNFIGAPSFIEETLGVPANEGLPLARAGAHRGRTPCGKTPSRAGARVARVLLRKFLASLFGMSELSGLLPRARGPQSPAEAVALSLNNEAARM